MVMAGASVAEAGLTVCAAVLISGILGLGAVLDALPSGTSFSVVLAAVGGCVAIPVGLVAFGPRLLALRGGATGNRRSIARGLLHAFVLHLVFFSLMGLTGWGIITVASNGLNTAGIAEVAGAVALSWLAGFILPGASAGLGVREATLFLLLSGSMGDATSLALAVLLRVATTLGDGVFFLAALALRDRKTPTEAAPEHNRSNA